MELFNTYTIQEPIETVSGIYNAIDERCKILLNQKIEYYTWIMIFNNWRK